MILAGVPTFRALPALNVGVAPVAFYDGGTRERICPPAQGDLLGAQDHELKVLYALNFFSASERWPQS